MEHTRLDGTMTQRGLIRHYHNMYPCAIQLQDDKVHLLPWPVCENNRVVYVRHGGERFCPGDSPLISEAAVQP